MRKTFFMFFLCTVVSISALQKPEIVCPDDKLDELFSPLTPSPTKCDDLAELDFLAHQMEKLLDDSAQQNAVDSFEKKCMRPLSCCLLSARYRERRRALQRVRDGAVEPNAISVSASFDDGDKSSGRKRPLCIVPVDGTSMREKKRSKTA